MSFFKISDKLEVKKSGVCSGKGVFAVFNIKRGEVLIDFNAKITRKPTNYTLQIGESSFLISNHIDNFINHSCDPNVLVKLFENDKRRVSYVALKDIKKGQELFWNYNTTEWSLVKKFACCCGVKQCVKRVCGMKYLTKNQCNKLLPLLSPYMKTKVKGFSFME